MIRRYQRELSVAATYGLLLLLLAIFRPDFFQSQFCDTWVAIAPALIAAAGMTLVILARHIDISIGAQFAVCAVCSGLLAQRGWSTPLGSLGTLCIGAALGAINGALIAFLDLPSVVVTLATMKILQDALSYLRNGAAVTGLPKSFQWFGLDQTPGKITIVGTAIVLFAGFMFVMRYVPAGRSVLAVGSDAEAARLAGIRPRRVVFFVFVLMGVLTAAAALIGSVVQPQIDPKNGQGMELEVIAAVVVGGTAISGGRGTLIGSLFGVALLGTIRVALEFFHSNPNWEKAIEGGIILLAVASDALRSEKHT